MLVFRKSLKAAVLAVGFSMLLGQSCLPGPGGGGTPMPEFPNTTDETNGGSTYVGSAACKACHPDVASEFNLHGHGHMLSKIEGIAPQYPSEATRAGVPNPPQGFGYDDVSYVIGGYIRRAEFADLNGFLLTTGSTQVNTQWNLTFPANGTTAGFAAFEPTATTAQPYSFTSCFQCHTTGPMAQDPTNPEFQDNRPGLVGTWHEEGVQCEACHGPGSRHIPDPSARNNFVDLTGEKTCNNCHSQPFGSQTGVIQASGGYIRNNQQHSELLASGAHSTFTCRTCHDPHVSINYDRANAIINECTVCHTDKTVPLHKGVVFVRGSYSEPVTCVSCHMPFATRSASVAGQDIVGQSGRMADMRTHIFRINTANQTYTAMFTADGSAVRKNAAFESAVTLDFACLRCHTDSTAEPNSSFELPLPSASQIAQNMHNQ
jgi:hypothetical protein